MQKTVYWIFSILVLIKVPGVQPVDHTLRVKPCRTGYYSEPLDGIERCCPCGECHGDPPDFVEACFLNKRGIQCRNQMRVNCYVNNRPAIPFTTFPTTTTAPMTTTAPTTPKVVTNTTTELAPVEVNDVNASGNNHLLIIAFIIVTCITVFLAFAVFCKRCGMKNKIKKILKKRKIHRNMEECKNMVPLAEKIEGEVPSSKDDHVIMQEMIESGYHYEEPQRQLKAPNNLCSSSVDESVLNEKSSDDMPSLEPAPPYTYPTQSQQQPNQRCANFHGNQNVVVYGQVYGPIIVGASDSSQTRSGYNPTHIAHAPVHSGPVRTAQTYPLRSDEVNMVNNQTKYDGPTICRQPPLPRQTSTLSSYSSAKEHDEYGNNNNRYHPKLRHQSSTVSSHSILGVRESEDSNLSRAERLARETQEMLWNTSRQRHLNATSVKRPNIPLSSMNASKLSHAPQESDSGESFSPKYPSEVNSLCPTSSRNELNSSKSSLELSDISSSNVNLYMPSD